MAPPSLTGDYAVGLEQLSSMNRDHNTTGLQQFGGASSSLIFVFVCFHGVSNFVI